MCARAVMHRPVLRDIAFDLVWAPWCRTPMHSRGFTRSFRYISIAGATALIASSLAVGPAAASDADVTPTLQAVDRAVTEVGVEPAAVRSLTDAAHLKTVETTYGLAAGTLEELVLQRDDVRLLELGAETTKAAVGGREVESSESVEGLEVVKDPLPNGFRVSVVIPSREKATSMTFDLGLKDGSRLEVSPSGGVAILDAGGYEIGHFDEPWAVDAAGRELETSYDVSPGGALTQHVDIDARTEFPVVADPTYSVCTPLGFSVGLCSTLTRSETLRVKATLDSYGGATAGAIGIICGIAGPVSWREVTRNRIRAVCGAALLVYQTNVVNNTNAAVSQGRCLRIIVYSVPGNVGAFSPTRVVSC